MSKRRRSKIGDTDRGFDPVARIVRAQEDVLDRFWIGGWVSMEDICKHYKEIDADLFAQIIFASEKVLTEHGPQSRLMRTLSRPL